MKNRQQKLIVAVCRKPRNPCLVASLFRQAGSHRATESSQRARANRALAQEIRKEIFT